MGDWLGPQEWQAVSLSVKVAFWATLGSLPPALIVAHALARWRFPGHALLNGLVHMPLILPPVVTGYLLLLAFGRRGPAGAFLEESLGIVLAFRWTGAALACAVMAFPLIVQPIRLSLQLADRRIEEAAATLGASRPVIWLTVTLPLMLPGLLTGVVLGFARALGEFGATITFVASIPGETRTIAGAIHTLLQAPDGEQAAIRLTVMSVTIAAAALALSEFLSRRSARRVSGQ
jgi:molybdate transport system permease protein